MLTLKELTENKTVALVGPSISLLDHSYGDEIDSADIVIRTNKALPLDPTLSTHIGTRCDVLYNCIEGHPRTSGNINPVLWKEHGVKLVVSSIPLNQRHPHIIHKIQNVLPLDGISPLFYNNLVNTIKCGLNTGFLGIAHVLSLNIKKLNLYGFTFYRDMAYPQYYKNVDFETMTAHINKIKDSAKNVNPTQKIHGHDFERQLVYFKNVFYKRDRRIQVDKPLLDILNSL